MADQSPRSRRPAVFKVGQRRRLVRHPSLSRSITSPYLHTASSRASVVNIATPPGASRSTMDLTSTLQPDDLFTHTQLVASPTPTTASSSMTATHGRRKFHLFGPKPTKDLDHVEVSADPAITTPLPPLTPSKAKQLLGFGPSNANSHVEPVESPFSTDPTIRNTRFREEGLEPDPPKKLSFWNGSNKAFRMLDMMPRHGRPALNDEHTDYPSSPTVEHEEPNWEVHPGNGTQTSPAGTAENRDKARRRRKKGPKMLEKMTPITEVSHDALNNAYRNSAHNTELDVISEYENAFPVHGASLLPRSPTDSILAGGRSFEEADRAHEEGDEVDGYMMHPGTEVDLNELEWRSPLQRVEDRLLDEAEEELIIQKAILDRHEATKIEIEEQVAKLKISHDNMKQDFGMMKQHATAHHPDRCKSVGADDIEDNLSSTSSCSYGDEEPVLEQATAVTIRNVTGQVKPIFITKRKKFDKPIGKESENLEPEQPTHVRKESYSRLNKTPRPKMPRDESQILVREWINDYNCHDQRPLSERIDPDVLADQKIPPAPLPKDDPSPYPPRNSSRHHCVYSGHHFRPINLKDVPDDVGINNLGVRPYFHTHAGVRQHVRVPVLCNHCGDDMNEEIWECEIAVCRLAVCGDCAMEMEQEWQQRAISTWQR